MSAAQISILIRDRGTTKAIVDMFLAGGDGFTVKPRHTVHGPEWEIIVEGHESEITKRVADYKAATGRLGFFTGIKFYNPI